VSMNGCVAVISIDTGCVLDVEPMSRFCKECQVHDKLDIASVEYKQWKAEHSNCKADFKGSAPAMEPEGADRIFKRSVESMASTTQSILVVEIVRASSVYRIHTKI